MEKKEHDYPLLDEQGEAKLLKSTPAWELDKTGIHTLKRTFSFASFDQSMAFANRVATLANEMWHHPNIHVLFKNVRIEIATHKLKGLTEYDFKLAQRIDAL